MLGEIATNPKANTKSLISKLQKVEYDYRPSGDSLTLDIIDRVRPQLKSLDLGFNLSIPFPFSPLLAIPILVDISVKRKVNVAGGMVARAELAKYPIVSVPINLNTHKTINLAGINPFGAKLVWDENNLSDMSQPVESQPVTRAKKREIPAATGTGVHTSLQKQSTQTRLRGTQRTPSLFIEQVILGAILLALVTTILYLVVAAFRGFLW